MQTKWESLTEAITNTGVGYVVSVFAGQVIYPFFNADVTIAENMGITASFTALAIARSFLMRRYFNWRDMRKQVKARLRQQ